MSEPPKRGRGRPSTFDRAAVLDAAMHAYWQDGPTGISLNAICQRTGISKPTLYREFGSEDGFTRAVLETYAAAVLTQVAGILTGPGRFSDKLAAIVDYASDSPLSDHGCLFVKMRAAGGAMGHDTRLLIDGIEAGGLEAYERFLTESREAGDWSGCIPTDLGARYLVAQIMLALTRRAAGDPPESIRDVLTLALSVFTATDRPG